MLRGGTTNHPTRRAAGARADVLLLIVAALLSCGLRAAAPAPRHWVDVGDGLPIEAVQAVAVDPADPEVVLVGLNGFVFKSDDAGDTWRPVLSFARGLAADPVAVRAAVERSGGAPIPGVGREVQDDDQLPLVPLVADDPADEAALAGDEAPEEEGSRFFDTDQDDVRERDRDADAAARAGEDGTDEETAAEEADDLPEGDLGGDDVTSTMLRTGPGVRAIRFLKESPGTVWIATARGLYRSVDHGERFVQIELPGGPEVNDVRDLAHDPLRPSRLYLATAAGLVVSKDGATTFQTGPADVGTTPALCVAVDASQGETQVLVGTEVGLFRSWDAGASFLQLLLKGVPANEPITALAFAADGQVTYAGTRAGLFASERKAAILEARDVMSGDAVTAISPDPSAPRSVTIGFFSTGVRLSANTGIEAVPIDQPPAARVLGLARAANDPAAILVATDRGLFRSLPGTGIREDPDRLKRLRARFAKEPGVQALIGAALLRAGIESTTTGDLALRARLAGLLPVVRADYRFKTGRTSERSFALIPGDIPPELDPDIDDPEAFAGRSGAFSIAPGVGTTHEFLVVAVWDLDRLVFDAHELRVSSVAGGVQRGQESLGLRVQELWAARRRLLVQIAMGEETGKGAKAEIASLLKLQQLTAQIDAVTGDALSRATQENGIIADDVQDLVGTEPKRRAAPTADKRRAR